jgi:hypothetical protein
MHPDAAKLKGAYLEFRVVSHHSLESNTDTLNDSQEHSAHDGRVTRSLHTTTDSKRTTGEETRNN